MKDGDLFLFFSPSYSNQHGSGVWSYTKRRWLQSIASLTLLQRAENERSPHKQREVVVMLADRQVGRGTHSSKTRSVGQRVACSVMLTGGGGGCSGGGGGGGVVVVLQCRRLARWLAMDGAQMLWAAIRFLVRAHSNCLQWSHLSLSLGKPPPSHSHGNSRPRKRWRQDDARPGDAANSIDWNGICLCSNIFEFVIFFRIFTSSKDRTFQSRIRGKRGNKASLSVNVCQSLHATEV